MKKLLYYILLISMFQLLGCTFIPKGYIVVNENKVDQVLQGCRQQTEENIKLREFKKKMWF